MAVSPCTVWCSADARPSPCHASNWSVRRAAGAQRLASAGTLVRVLAPPVKAGMSQGRQARRATASYHAICGARYSVPHRVSTLSVQASPRHGSESIASANIGRNVARVVCTPVLSRQLVQKCSGLLEISCVKALREPAVDRRQQPSGFQALTLALPQAGRAHGGAQFPRLRLLAASHFEGLAPSARSSRQRRGVQLS